jgi:hypothetical protein
LTLGYEPAYSNTGDNVNAFGLYAGYGNTSYSVNALGTYAAGSNDGNNTNAFGSSAAYDNQGQHVNAFGQSACAYNTGSHVTAMGYEAAHYNNGSQAIAIGDSALYGSLSITEGIGNIAIGYRAMNAIGAGEQNICIGYDTQVSDPDSSFQINIGNSIIRDSFGVIRLKDLIQLTPTTAPAVPERGMIYYDDADDMLYCWDGDSWEALW